MVHMGYGQKQATYGRGFDRKYEGVKASAESKKPDISWHFEGCVLGAALLHFILCAENLLSGSRSIPDWIPWNLHEARTVSSKHFTFKSVECIVFKEIEGFLDACSLSQSSQQGFRFQILMLCLPHPIHLLDKLLDFGALSPAERQIPPPPRRSSSVL